MFARSVGIVDDGLSLLLTDGTDASTIAAFVAVEHRAIRRVKVQMVRLAAACSERTSPIVAEGARVFET